VFSTVRNTQRESQSWVGQKLDTEETSKQKKLKQTEGTTLEVTGAIDYNPVVSTDYTERGL